ncbi:phage virion morphogenesis protein [Yersinia mollaretii ATCC 43969]|nr:phage virion morphogenesis protein [Yersinia mollaretii ATCC 43969]
MNAFYLRYDGSYSLIFRGHRADDCLALYESQQQPDEAVVEFVGRVERMAAVHNFGLRDWPSVHSQGVKYGERPLLGFDNVTLDEIEITCIEHVNIWLLYLI